MREIMTWGWRKGLEHVGKRAIWIRSWSQHGATRQRACDWQPQGWGGQDLAGAGAGDIEGNRNSWRGDTGTDVEFRGKEKDTGSEGLHRGTGRGAAGERKGTEKRKWGESDLTDLVSDVTVVKHNTEQHEPVQAKKPRWERSGDRRRPRIK